MASEKGTEVSPDAYGDSPVGPSRQDRASGVSRVSGHRRDLLSLT